MLSHKDLYDVVKKTTLSSVDLLFVSNGCVLLGKRTNNPARGYLFNPGGKVYKMETQKKAIQRLAKAECGIVVDEYKHLGVYDHIYDTNFKNDNVKTHYVSNCYLIHLPDKVEVQGDTQHSCLQWVDIQTAITREDCHPYVKLFLVDYLE